MALACKICYFSWFKVPFGWPLLVAAVLERWPYGKCRIVVCRWCDWETFLILPRSHFVYGTPKDCRRNETLSLALPHICNIRHYLVSQNVVTILCQDSTGDWSTKIGLDFRVSWQSRLFLWPRQDKSFFLVNCFCCAIYPKSRYETIYLLQIAGSPD